MMKFQNMHSENQHPEVCYEGTLCVTCSKFKSSFIFVEAIITELLAKKHLSL